MMKKVEGGGGESGCEFLKIVNQTLILHFWIANL
jgi:hypothetical protein